MNIENKNNNGKNQVECRIHGGVFFVALGTNPRATLRQYLALGADAESVVTMDFHAAELEGPATNANGDAVHISIPRTQGFLLGDLDCGAVYRAHRNDSRTRKFASTLEGIQGRTGDGAGPSGRAGPSAVERMQRSEIYRFLADQFKRFLSRSKKTESVLSGQIGFRSRTPVVLLVEGGGQAGNGILLKVYGHLLGLAREFGVDIAPEVWITTPAAAEGRQRHQPAAAFIATLRELNLVHRGLGDTVDEGFANHNLVISKSPAPLIRLMSVANSEMLFDRDDRRDAIARFVWLRGHNPTASDVFFHNNGPTEDAERYSGVGCGALCYDVAGLKAAAAAEGMIRTTSHLFRPSDGQSAPEVPIPTDFAASISTGVLFAQQWGLLSMSLDRTRGRDAGRYGPAAVDLVARIQRSIEKELAQNVDGDIADAKKRLELWWRDAVDRRGIPTTTLALDRLNSRLVDLINERARESDEARTALEQQALRTAALAEGLRARASVGAIKRAFQFIRGCLTGKRTTGLKTIAAEVIDEARNTVHFVERAAATSARRRYCESLKDDVECLVADFAAIETEFDAARASASRLVERARQERRLQTAFVVKLPLEESVVQAMQVAYPPERIAAICRDSTRATVSPRKVVQLLRDRLSQVADDLDVPENLAAYFSSNSDLFDRCMNVLVATAQSTLPHTIESSPDCARPIHRVVYAPEESLAILKRLLEPRVTKGADHVDWRVSPFSGTLTITEEIRNLRAEDIPEVVRCDREFESLSPDYRRRFVTVFSEEEVAATPLIPRGLTHDTAPPIAAEALALDVLQLSAGYVYRDSCGEEVARGWDQLVDRLASVAGFADRIQKALHGRRAEVGRAGILKRLEQAATMPKRLAAPRHHVAVRKALSHVIGTHTAPAPVPGVSSRKDGASVAGRMMAVVNDWSSDFDGHASDGGKRSGGHDNDVMKLRS